MNVTVKLLGTLRKFSHPDSPGELKIDLPSDSTVADLINRIIKGKATVVACAINGRTRNLDTVICEGDEVILLSKLGGG